jgi:hypothetical protein
MSSHVGLLLSHYDVYGYHLGGEHRRSTTEKMHIYVICV